MEAFLKIRAWISVQVDLIETEIEHIIRGDLSMLLETGSHQWCLTRRAIKIHSITQTWMQWTRPHYRQVVDTKVPLAIRREEAITTEKPSSRISVDKATASMEHQAVMATTRTQATTDRAWKPTHSLNTSLKDDHLMRWGAKLAILKIKIIVNLEQAMILDMMVTKEMAIHTTVKITKNMGLAPSLKEADMTGCKMRTMPSTKMQRQRWRILLWTSHQVAFDQIQLNLNRSRPNRKPRMRDISMETKANKKNPLRDTMRIIIKAWANPSKIMARAFTRERPCRQIPTQHLQIMIIMHQKKEHQMVTGRNVQAVVESLTKRPS